MIKKHIYHIYVHTNTHTHTHICLHHSCFYDKQASTAAALGQVAKSYIEARSTHQQRQWLTWLTSGVAFQSVVVTADFVCALATIVH